VLQQAMRHEMAESFFNEPVDAVALGIPDYHDVIKVGWLQLQPALVHDLAPNCITLTDVCSSPDAALSTLSIGEQTVHRQRWQSELAA
jgi:hypothetical protein